MNNAIHTIRYTGRLILLLSLSWCMTGIVVKGQQPTLITHYMFTNMATNPACAGGKGGIDLTGLVRSQYMGWKDPDGTKSAPQTFLLTADSPIRLLHGGLGLSISQDQIGYFKNIIVKLDYAYRMEAMSGDLSFGINGSLSNISYDGSKWKPIDTDDNFLTNRAGKQSDLSVDMGLGIFYNVPEKYYLGLSAENILQTKGKKTGYQLRRTYYLNGGYQWTVPDHPDFEVLPSIQFLYDGAAFQMNVDALVMYNNKFYGGIGYRLQDAVSILAGLYIKGVHIGVAYDIVTSEMRHYNSGGLEILLNYCFKIDTDKYKRTYRNTRFL